MNQDFALDDAESRYEHRLTELERFQYTAEIEGFNPPPDHHYVDMPLPNLKCGPQIQLPNQNLQNTVGEALLERLVLQCAALRARCKRPADQDSLAGRSTHFYTHIPVTQKLVRCKISEDLLCANSKLMKDLIQPRRRGLQSKCRLCDNPMAPLQRLLWCRPGCGRNVHYICYVRWLSNKDALKCPTCTADWTGSANGDDYTLTTRPNSLEPSPWYMYFGWLLSNGASTLSKIEPDLELFGQRLLECHHLACNLRDNTFKDYVLHLWSLFCRQNPPGWVAVCWAYRDFKTRKRTIESLATQKLVVDHTVALPNKWRDDIHTLYTMCPPQFETDVERWRL